MTYCLTFADLRQPLYT